MKLLLSYSLAALLFLTSIELIAQGSEENKKMGIRARDIEQQKGNFFFYWGYNRSNYAKSDITLEGPNYNFTLAEAKAKDLPKEFSSVYFDIGQFTVPQFNIRMGYFLSDKYSIAVGWDHMKYQTIHGSTAILSGSIDASASAKYQGEYDEVRIRMNDDELVKMEHSDGFNIVNVNLERSDFIWYSEDQKLALGLISGAGIGIAMPWTNSLVFGKHNDDRPHFSGMGAQAFVALQGTFYKRFFLRFTAQGGFANMWDIAITPRGDHSAHAEQTIWYFERSLVLGYQFRLWK